jgi:selenocysteine lyase/cysteine desulfurase
MRRLGVSATARASVAVHNETSDIDALVGALQSAREVFGLA